MPATAVIPGWVTLPDWSLIDAAYLTDACYGHTRSERDRGRAFTVAWVMQGGPSPLDDNPAGTHDVAPVERGRVFGVLTGLERELEWTPLPARREFLRGAQAVLLWLIGAERDPGINLPSRHPDGRVMTQEELYDAAGPFSEPEQRRAARDQAAAVASMSEGLAAFVDAAMRGQAS